jgi:N-acetylglucosaminyl-diphospho-decaprenol L-rhamnosyltransferase
MSLDVVIVHYRAGVALARCINACLRIDRVSSVLVVDNEGVAPGFLETHSDSRLRWVRMKANVGFGRAANEGLDRSAAVIRLVLNPDTVPSAGAVEEMVRVAADSGAWIVGPRLVDGTGCEMPAKTSFPAPLRWHADGHSGDGWRQVPWITGAAMLFTPGHTDLRFDRRIFMYAEDEELCYRVWAEGGSVAIAERAQITHEGGTATRQRWSSRQIALRTTVNRARFIRWHAGWRALPRFAAEVSRRLRDRSK